MKYLFRGKRGGLIAFLAVAALVVGGLGWATAAALRLEAEQARDRAQAEFDDRLRLAMSLLDNRLSAALTREDNRPFDHYSALFATPLALAQQGGKWQPTTVLEPSPLLGGELPDWLLLHFQIDQQGNWTSPQVLSATLHQRLLTSGLDVSLANVTPAREQLLNDLKCGFQPAGLITQVQERGAHLAAVENTILLAQADPANDAGNSLQMKEAQQQQRGKVGYDERFGQMVKNQAELKGMPQRANRDVVLFNYRYNGEEWLARTPPSPQAAGFVTVSRGPMVRLWLATADGRERLLVARQVRVGDRPVCQGFVLDWDRLQTLLTEEVVALFPGAAFRPVRDITPPHPERTMSNLPVELDPGEEPPADASPGWTPLRAGLTFAWSASLLALLTVALGSWSLLDLSERRIRFVSAVTHELRTPLTTLRLYLDMLTGGLVREPKQRDEYLQTLHAEAERLHRLIANVLDFSRLENQRSRLNKAPVKLGELLRQVGATWQAHCQAAGKELIVESGVGEALALETDGELVQQVLGNLIDNACKYSRGAADPHVWLRVEPAAPGRIAIEVEDRGPGVAARERRQIFRPFRRGRGTETTAGGVGLGLALALRWARLLGGTLNLCGRAEQPGACFRLELPLPAGEREPRHDETKGGP